MKRRTKNYQSKDSNSKYTNNWEQTFGKHQNDLDEYIKEKSENNPKFGLMINELVERKFSRDSIDKVMTGIKQSSDGEVRSVNFGDMCDDCKKHLSECDCEEEETEFEKNKRLREIGESLFEKSDTKIKKIKISYISLFEFIILKIKDFYRWLLG